MRCGRTAPRSRRCWCGVILCRIPQFRTPPGEQPCTYLVAYEGAAEDLTAWLAHYIADHPPIMARFPGIRQIEIYTCIDWCGGLPWPRVAHMQRNKVVFDNQAALTAALNSPVRHEMREAFHRFPSFTGPITHFPMATTTVMPKTDNQHARRSTNPGPARHGHRRAGNQHAVGSRGARAV